MGSHAQQPSPQQLQPLVKNNHDTWVGFTKAAAIGVISTVILLGLMAVTLL